VAHSAVRPKQSRPSRRLVPLEQAGEYAACSVKTIRRRIADGTLTGYRFGPRALRVDLDELDAALRPIPTAGGGAA
jgi:excisionase family DNA binding protein